MFNGSFSKTVLWLLVVILLPITMFSSVFAQKRGNVSPLEVSLYVPGGRSFQASSTSFSLSDGIELMGSYKPARYFNLAGVFTHYADATSGNYEQEKSKFGAGVFVATDWQNLYQRSRQFNFVYYRAKIVAIYDITGIKINTGESESVGRLRESRIIVGLEFGLKAGQGMAFMGFSYLRSMNSFSGGAIDTGNNNHFVFNVGISLL